MHMVEVRKGCWVSCSTTYYHLTCLREALSLNLELVRKSESHSNHPASAPPLPQHAGLIGITMPGFLCRWWNIDLGSSCLCSQCPYWSSHLLRLICWGLWPWFQLVTSVKTLALCMVWMWRVLHRSVIWTVSGVWEILELLGCGALLEKVPSSVNHVLSRYSICQSSLLLSLLSATQIGHDPLALFGFLSPGFTHAICLQEHSRTLHLLSQSSSSLNTVDEGVLPHLCLGSDNCLTLGIRVLWGSGTLYYGSQEPGTCHQYELGLNYAPSTCKSCKWFGFSEW